MIRLVCPVLLVVAVAAQARADGDVAGIWRQETESVGVSYWELAAKKDGTYEAFEVGLGNARGTARLKDGRLVIEWSNGTASGTYEWTLKGVAGNGKCTVRPTDGDVQVFEKSSVRFVGK